MTFVKTRCETVPLKYIVHLCMEQPCDTILFLRQVAWTHFVYYEMRSSFDKLNVQYKTGIQIRKDEYALYSCRAVRVFFKPMRFALYRYFWTLAIYGSFRVFFFSRHRCLCIFLNGRLLSLSLILPAGLHFTWWARGAMSSPWAFNSQQVNSCVWVGVSTYLVTHPSLTLALDWVILGYFAVCYSTPAIMPYRSSTYLVTGCQCKNQMYRT